MQTKIIAALMVGAAAIVASAAASAQSANPPAKNKQIRTEQKVAMTTRRPVAKLTVRKRSYLDPGTETKARAEHYMDYAEPPGDPNSRFQNNYGITFTRSPLPSCFDLAGFCR